MIIRELLTSMGIDFDTRGADAAEKRIGGLKNALETVGTVLTFGGVFAGLKTVVGYASDAEQTLSKLRMNFVENTDSVLAWADATAKATGASKYELREFAGTMGSMLVPTLKGNRKLAAEMSTTLSALAVDLAAVNNDDPKETLGRLFSGMTGETEGVERLGIGIKQAALQEFAHERGIKKKITAMTIAEKTELIYAKILKDTKDKTGAAGREAGSYAGRMQRLGSTFKEAATNLGMKLLPYATDFVSLLQRGAGALGDWTADTQKVAAAFTVLGSLMAAMGVSLLIANLPLIAFAVGLALVVVAVEDLGRAFSGQTSVIGTFMEYLVGDKNWKRLSELPSKLGDIMFEMGLTPKQKKDRGIGFVEETNLFDFLGPLMGEDPTELKKRIQAGIKKGDRIAGARQAGEAGRIAARRVEDGLGMSSVAGYEASLQSVAPTMQTQTPRQQFGWNGPISNTVIVNGNADPKTIPMITEAMRQLIIEERRQLKATTTDVRPDGFENNGVADEENISSGFN